LNIIYHLPCAIIGGAETQLLYLANIVSESHEVMITYEYPQIEAFLFKNFKTKNFYRITSPILLAKKIAEFKPDIIQYYHCPTMYNYLGKINLGNTKVVEVAHNRTSFVTDCSTYGKDRTDVLVCVSQSAKDHYITKRGEDVPMTIIPNGIDTDVFVPKPPSVPKPILTGGYCGRFEAGNGKGVKMLIDLISDLPVKFELVGYDFGNHKERLKRAQNIRFFQHTNNIVTYYHKWDFFVSCSPAEGFGLAIAEALACGLPCVILDCGGICDYLAHRKHAYIAKDQDDVANGIREVIAGARYEPLSIDFSAKKMASLYLDLYSELVRSSSERSLHTPQLRTPAIGARRSSKAAMTEGVTLGIVPEGWESVRTAVRPRVDSLCTPEASVAQTMLRAPSKIIWGGFIPTHLPIMAKLRAVTDAEIILSYHLTAVGNAFESLHRQGLMKAVEAVRLGYASAISTPHEGVSEALGKAYGVPSLYEMNKLELIAPPEGVLKLEGLHIGVFGTGLPWKNMDTQFLAAAMTPGVSAVHAQEYKPGLMASNPNHLDFLRSFKTQHVIHPYHFDRKEFFKLAAKMRINLAISFSESFGYLPLESYMLGVPAIVGATTPSFKTAEGALRKCIVNATDDPKAISDAIVEVLNDYDNVLAMGQQLCQKLADMS